MGGRAERPEHQRLHRHPLRRRGRPLRSGDHRHLHTLRALADAVVVGAQTVVADDPQLTVRLVGGKSPVRVVLDPHGRTPASARVFTDGGATLWLVGQGIPERPGVETVRLDDAGFPPVAVVALLRERGLERVLVEGGGRTVSGFLSAGALDRLFVTVVPRFLGDGVPGVRPAAGAAVRRDPAAGRSFIVATHRARTGYGRRADRTSARVRADAPVAAHGRQRSRPPRPRSSASLSQRRSAAPRAAGSPGGTSRPGGCRPCRARAPRQPRARRRRAPAGRGPGPR